MCCTAKHLPVNVSQFVVTGCGFGCGDCTEQHVFCPVGETHGTSGQCVSFSLIDAGSVLLPA